MVFYLKYRPQTISELDLSQVREKLFSLLKSKSLPHAFLFTGPKGLGKTSTARILAKAINCEQKKKDNEPCNKCEACISITNGSNIDVLEIDAASNRGIDEMRALRERVKFAPANLKKKVYIIDEVHMLTTEAFNALLKTLEEPPDHVVFILCTTEVWKVLPTIVSRSFHISFEKPTKEELKRSLERVAKGEGLTIEKGVYDRLYELADGAFRDATKILEELAVAAGEDKKITEQLLESTYKVQSIDVAVTELIQKLDTKDVKAALAVIEKLVNEGVDFKIVTEKIVEALRRELFAKTSLSSDKTTTQFTVTDLKNLFQIFNDSYKNMKFSVIPQLPLEIAVITWCNSEEKQEVVVSQKIETKIVKDTPSVLPEKSVPVVAVSSIKTERNDGDFFSQLIEAIKQDNHTIAGILRGCTLVSVDDGQLKIEARYKFHGERLGEAKARRVIEEQASRILQKNIELIIQTKQ
jgi:DNA polymerase-3 subunit gamma/tau